MPDEIEDRRLPQAWGGAASQMSEREAEPVLSLLRARFSEATWDQPPPLPEVVVPPARLTIPAALAEIATADPAERRLHAAGRSFSDMVALREGPAPTPPDVVARPRNADETAAILEWCEQEQVACVPFGGGTSVVGGVDATRADRDGRGVVVLQMRRMSSVREVDRISRAARIEAGATGPRLEAQLRPHGLTMRFFPQSFEMSTLGGWIVTRAGGHYATRLTHIDDLVESIEAVTPRGLWASRRLPGSGAGPSPDRMLLGSEGILGVVTSAWVRVQDRPRHKAGLTVRFASLEAALDGLRVLVQSGLDPANCRVLDPVEAAMNGAGDGSSAVLIVGFESAAVDVGADLAAAVELLADHGGTAAAPSARRAHDDADPAAAWKRSFLRAPYLRDRLVDAGAIIETFETAATWDRLLPLIEEVTAATQAALTEVCGDGFVTCRITHAYPDGAAPYFTVIAPGRRAARIQQWAEIKAAASEALLAAGGTITHHHAVGRDHRPWYDRQRPDVFAAALAGAKAAVDPAGILNPAVLLD